MSRPIRFILVIIGLLLVCCSLIVLVYAFWPTEMLRTEATLVPTFFVPP